MAVRVRNTSKEPYRDRFNGEEYVIGPGEVAVVPDGAAALWLGRVNLPGAQGDAERKRAALRRGGTYPPLVVDKGQQKTPSAPAREYPCEICGEVFDHHMRLKAHIKSEHPDGPNEPIGSTNNDE